MAQAAPAQHSGLLPPPPMLPQQQPAQQPAQQPLNITQMLPMPETNAPLPAPLPFPANTQSGQPPFTQTLNQTQFSQAQSQFSSAQPQFNNTYTTNQVPQQQVQLPPANMMMPAPAPQPYFTQYQASYSQFPQIIPQTGLPANFNMGLPHNMHAGAGPQSAQNALALLQNIATTQMIGNLAGNLLKGQQQTQQDPYKKKSAPSERRRYRSPSPKRRHRSRSESPRNRNKSPRGNGKRRRNRSPQHKKQSPAKLTSPPHSTPPAVESEPETSNIYQPPTPPALPAPLPNPEKTPEYKSESTPRTPDYSARSPTPEYDTTFSLPTYHSTPSSSRRTSPQSSAESSRHQQSSAESSRHQQSSAESSRHPSFRTSFNASSHTNTSSRNSSLTSYKSTPEFRRSCNSRDDTLFKDPDNKVSPNVASILNMVNKNIATVKPSNRLSPVKTAPAEPRMVSLKTIASDSPAPNIKIKSLTDILREQALQSMMKKKPSKAISPVPDSQESEEDSRSRSPLFPARNERSTTDSQTLSNPFGNIDQAAFVSEDSESEGLDSPPRDSSWWAKTDDKFRNLDNRQSGTEEDEDELLEEPTITLTRNFSPEKKPSKKKLEKRKAKEEKKRLKEAKKKLKAIKRQKAAIAAQVAAHVAELVDVGSDSEDGILNSDEDNELEEGEVEEVDEAVLEEGEIIKQAVKMKKLPPIRAIPVNPMNWQRNLIAKTVKRPPRSANISRIKFPGVGHVEETTNGGSPRLSPSVTPEREEAASLSTPEKQEHVTSPSRVTAEQKKPLARSPPKTKVRVISTKRPRIVRTSKVSTTTLPKVTRTIPISTSTTQVVAPQVSEAAPSFQLQPIQMSRITPITFNDVPVVKSNITNSGTSNVTSSNGVTTTVKPKGINPFARASTNHGEVSSTQPEKKSSPPRASSSTPPLVRPTSSVTPPLRPTSSTASLPTRISTKRVVLKARNVRTVKPTVKAVEKPALAKKSYLDDFEEELKLLNAALSEPSTKEKKTVAPVLDVDNDDDLFDDIDSLLGY